MLESQVCTIGEVAAALGRSERYIRGNWRRLHRDNNFPRPLPGSDYARWSRFAVMAWLRSSGQSVETDDEPGDLVSQGRAAIHAELGVDTWSS